MSSTIHVLSVSGFDYNLPKRKAKKGKWYIAKHGHKSATSHDDLAINRLKILFQKDGALWKKTCHEISDSSTVKVKAHLIFFADRHYDFKKQKPFKQNPVNPLIYPQAITLEFSGKDLHAGDVRIPDNEILRAGILRLPKRNPRSTDDSGVMQSDFITKLRTSNLDQIKTKQAKILTDLNVKAQPCDFLLDKTGVKESHYYFNKKYYDLFDVNQYASALARNFGGFLTLYTFFKNKTLDYKHSLRDDFLNDVENHINKGYLAEALDVLSIDDIYQTIESIGQAKEQVLELSVFSHGWIGGPVLVNSSDKRPQKISLWLDYDISSDNPSAFAKSTDKKAFLKIMQRDPYDKDARTRYDFLSFNDRFHDIYDRLDSELSTAEDQSQVEAQLTAVRERKSKLSKKNTDVINHNKLAETGFGPHSRVLLWGCSAVTLHKRLIQAFNRNSKINRRTIKANLIQYWSQQHPGHKAGLDRVKGEKAYAQHVKALAREQSANGCYNGPDQILTSSEGFKSGYNQVLTNGQFKYSFSSHHTYLIYSLDKSFAFPESEAEALKAVKKLETNINFWRAAACFGPHTDTDKSIYQSEVNLEYVNDFSNNIQDIIKDGRKVLALLKGIRKRTRKDWSATMTAALISFYLDIPGWYNWRMAFAWNVEVHGAPSGAGSLFEFRRDDRYAKQKILSAKKKGQTFFPLNDIGFGYKHYSDGAAAASYDIFNFYRQLFALPISCNQLLAETRGYVIYSPDLNSFWNAIFNVEIKEALRYWWVEN